MSHAQSSFQTGGAGTDPVDTTGLCLLALDGGGVRGLSALHILKGIMEQLNHERTKSGLDHVKPCDVFDMIGGTSTGGLIAIMLGRLEMDVDECIAAYNKLSAVVFSEPKRRIPVSFRGGMVAARYDSKRLKEAILEVIAGRNLPPDTPFDDGQERGCKVFACAASKDLNGTERLRAYSYPWKKSLPCTICEAALATSAASGFFDPVQIGARHYIDAALGANNPVEQVEAEASDLWCRETGELKPLVKCFISIGVGNPGKKPINDRLDKFFKTLVDITTETESTAARFIKRWRQQYDEGRFFRFNVEQGLQDVGLQEYDKRGVIETATDQYMAETVQESRVRECVQNLKAKQSRPGEGFEQVMKEFIALKIVDDHGPQRTRSRPVHLIPFQRNRRFVGRASVIDKLKAQLFADDGEGPRQISLTGLGGTGKTQVALYLAYWVKQNKPEWSVFWVPAISPASFEQAYKDMARLLDLGGADDNTTTKQVQDYLDSDESGRWLLIIDNIDEEEVARGGEQGVLDFLPCNDRGRILFTTRVRSIAVRLTQGDVICLSQMSEDEAHELFRKSMADEELLMDKRSVAELLEILTCLPLAIVQAAAYMNETMASVSEYIWLLQNTERSMVELLETKFADNTRYPEAQNAVASTMAVSFDQIQKNKEAAMLLSFIARVEFKAIPRSMLPSVGSEQMMTRAVGVLRGYSFLGVREDGETYDMHRLVHLSSRVWVARQGDADRQRRAVLQHLTNIFRTCELEERETWRSWLPHALKAIEVHKGNNNWGEEESHIGYWVGMYLMDEGRYREAVEVLEQVVAACEAILAETDDHRLASQSILGSAYHLNGQMKESIDILERVVAIHQETLREAHSEQLLISQEELALSYQKGGRTEDAIGILQRTVAIRKKTQPETHPDILHSQAALAVGYDASGRIEEGVELLEWVLAIHKKTLPGTHLDLLDEEGY
ncbi:acyl transferase/acyl hydrolase/lysophospholipase [Chaetomium tenue]|uniref:Acyl transferase/acyl hydrolase/lysophospholipase n=1 Tax=Chaetomium tenue TaxID=1854479 RepID=A0ACB7PM76_9PEZI|nr:acyl transferase/acyl hydrolase/lysophospholipase [Chaetomium globosum]